jgi:hypothetical protein
MLIGDIEGLSKCIECKSDLISGASKCAQCGAFQNWRRYTNPIVIAAGFILTWLSIWTAPPIKELFIEHKAKMRISILEGDVTHLKFMLSNIGNSPAALSKISISAILESGVNPTWYLNSGLDKKLLEPNQAHVVSASNSSVIPSAVPHETIAAYNERYGAFPENCKLILEYVQLNGTKEYLFHPFACYAVDPTSKNELFDEN